jgi:hypothetical protein
VTEESPIAPLVEGTRRATIHLAKAAFEVATAVGALATGLVRTVRPAESAEEGDHGPHHVPVE